MSTSFTDRKPKDAVDGCEKQRKRHTLLIFGYLGTGYFGLQSQSAEGDPERPTISDVVRRSLLTAGFIAESNYAPLERTKWTLASRTDKGVHAVCGAASVKLETYDADVLDQKELLRRNDPMALAHQAKVDEYMAHLRLVEEKHGMTHAEALSQGKKLPIGRAAPADDGEWQLSEEALARLNSVLPPEVCAFAGTRVSKKFSAHEDASARIYEYMLPVHALGDMAVDEFDTVLRRFEGNNRFHNFASGLRVAHAKSQNAVSDDGEEWPLALAPGGHNSAAYRSVITCRVHDRLSLGGTDYLVLRIAGLAFVLHQIRHMVGAAIAVANGLVPLDVFDIALRSPLRVDVAPLVPGMGLLLDEISWFDLRTGEHTARLPDASRDRMQSFKRDVVYPHIHELYADGAYDAFLKHLHSGELATGPRSDPAGRRDPEFERLRRVHASWLRQMEESNLQRQEERRCKREQRALQDAEARAAASDDGVAGKVADSKSKQRLHKSLLPGGMHVQICVQYQCLPGPQTHQAMTLLKSMVEAGQLNQAEPYSYYLKALQEAMPEGLGGM